MLLLCALIVGSTSAWATGVTFQRITNISDLEAGKRYLVVNEGSKKALGALNNNKLAGVTVTISSNTIVLSESSDVNILTLGGTTDEYTLSGNKTNYIGWSSSTNFSTSTSASTNNYKWKITFSSNNVLIKNVSDDSRLIRYYSSGGDFRAYTSSNGSHVQLYKEVIVKSPVGTFSSINEVAIPYNDWVEFDPSDYFTKADGATGDVSFSVTPTSGDIYYKDGYLCATAAGSQEFTITATPAAADATYYEEVTKTFTATCTDNRPEIGSITAISPTTVYVGQTGAFTLTENYVGTVSSKIWSLGSGEDAYLELADGTFAGLSSGSANVSITATPSESTYKPVKATFPVSVEYKYAAPALPITSAFFTTKSITIPAIAGADVYYTTDGTTPTSSSTKYTAAFDVSATTTVKAIAIDDEGLVSPVSSATYTKEDVLDINSSEITFQDFSGAGGGYDNGAEKNLTFTATDGETKLKITGTNIMSNSGLQVRSTPGTFTTQYIKNGAKAFSLTATFTQGLSYKISYADGSDDTSGTLTSETAITPNSFPCKFTFTRSIGTPVITKIVLTPLKDPVATELAIKDPGTLAKDANGTFAYTAYDEEDNTASWTSATTSVVRIDNAETGAYTAIGRGTSKITLTLTPTDAMTYRTVTAERTVTVTAPVEVSASDVAMTYGDVAKAIGATTSAGYAGTLTYESGNTSIATVDATGKVTAVAVGSTTITISAPADAENLYTAGEDKVINVTVSAPTGKTTVQKGNTTSTATLDFTDNTTWGFPTEYETSKNTYSNGTYSITLEGGTAGDGYKFGVFNEETFTILGKTNATLTFQAFDKFLTQIDITGRDGASTKVTQNIYVGDVAVSTQTTGCTGKNVYHIAENYQAPGNIYTLKVTNGNNTQFTEIVLHFADARKEDVTLNASGYATSCSASPLDFSDYETADFSAWQITSIEDGVITFEQITSSVKGGTGILIKGEAGSTVTINSANSETALLGNKLVGTLAPTYFDTDEIYGLAGNTFMHNNAGTFKANKAYIPASVIDDAGSNATRTLTFVFVDPTTGITETQNVNAEEFGDIFNLAGQRLSQPQRGVNIINGKKVLVK